MLTQVNYEVKGQLAKLLATEDLIIENRKVSTASFDTERRVLTLPMWEKASGVVYDLLVGHEVGHALHTPADNWTIDYPDVPMSYVNVLEDVRIEKFMKQRYPGLSKTFYNGYSQLAEQDFFELDKHDLNDMGLADRINIHYKIGKFEKVSFETDEEYFVNQASKTETFEDVLELAEELYKHVQRQEEILTSLDDLEFDMGQPGGSGSGDGQGDMKMPFDRSDAEGEQSDNELDPEKGQGGSPDVNNMTNKELLEENIIQENKKIPTNQDELISSEKIENSSFQVKEITAASPSIKEIKYLIDTWLANKSNYMAGKAEINLSGIVKDGLIKRTIAERQKDIKKGVYKEISSQIQEIVLKSQTSSRIVALAELKYSERIFKNSGELVNETSLNPLKVKYILGFSNKSWTLVDFVSGL